MRTTVGITLAASLFVATTLSAQTPTAPAAITNAPAPISGRGFVEPLRGQFAPPLTNGFGQPLTGGVTRPLTGTVPPLTGTPLPITNTVPPVTTTPLPTTGRVPFLSPTPFPPVQNETIVVGEERPLEALRSNNFFLRTNQTPANP